MVILRNLWVLHELEASVQDVDHMSQHDRRGGLGIHVFLIVDFFDQRVADARNLFRRESGDGGSKRGGVTRSNRICPCRASIASPERGS